MISGFIDIHTHNAVPDASQSHSVFNYLLGRHKECPAGRLFSAGLHPWYIDDYKNSPEHELASLAGRYKDLIAIGECGLDKVRGPNLEKQTAVFTCQAELAARLDKPLIIHCVRCFNELIALRKQLRHRNPWIIHGFNQSPQMAKALLKFDFYFSFGEALLIEKSKAALSLPVIPVDHLFFETDESNIAIGNVYKAAVEILSANLDSLIFTIEKNFQNCFYGNS